MKNIVELLLKAPEQAQSVLSSLPAATQQSVRAIMQEASEEILTLRERLGVSEVGEWIDAPLHEDRAAAVVRGFGDG